MYARLFIPLMALTLVVGCRVNRAAPPAAPIEQPVESPNRPDAPQIQVTSEEAQAIADALAGVDEVGRTYGTVLKFVQGQHPSAAQTAGEFLRDVRALQTELSTGLTAQGLALEDAPEWFQHQVQAVKEYAHGAAALDAYCASGLTDHLTTAEKHRQAAVAARDALARYAR